MKEQDLAKFEAQLLGKVVARLYLKLLPQSGPEGIRARIHDTLSVIDKQCGIQRPSSQELHQWAKQTAKGNTEIKGGMVWRMLEEITVFTQGEFGAQYTDELRTRIETLFVAALEDESVTLSEAERQQIFTAVINDSLGLGPLEPILADSTVVEVMVDGPEKVYLERHSKFEDTPYRFRDEAHLMSIIHRIVAPLGGQLNESHPMVDFRLPDASRVNVVIPPISLTGPVMTIRKFPKHQLSLEDLIRFGTLSEEITTFLHACVQSRLNILVSGGTGGGKTSLLNVLAQMIPDDERIITIENAVELHGLSETKKYVVTLESRPPNIEGEGEVSIRDLVVNALRMRPDRIILGEIRSGEALELIQAINRGHDGCMATIHAVAPPDAVQRLETVATMHPTSLPVLAIREMIAAAIDVIVQVDRLPDGSRKITRVTEVLGLEGNVVVMQDIFQFKTIGREGERVVGYHLPTGIIPKFLSRFQAHSIEVPLSLFTPKL
jgi:pilus assembly protein CpaF